MPHISILRCGSLRRHDTSSQPSTPIRHFLDRVSLLLDAGDVADGAASGAGGEGSVGLEGLGDLAGAGAGCHAAAPFASMVARRLASSASEMLKRRMRLGMSISMVSPSSTKAMAPASAASGEMWPMQRPELPPEKRPSVTRALDCRGPWT